jgi:hypothetical protein
MPEYRGTSAFGRTYKVYLHGDVRVRWQCIANLKALRCARTGDSVGSKTVIVEIEASTWKRAPAGFNWDREHMDVLGYYHHMQTIIPDFRRLVHAHASADAVLLVVTDEARSGLVGAWDHQQSTSGMRAVLLGWVVLGKQHPI